MANRGQWLPLICLIRILHRSIIFIILALLFPVQGCKARSVQAEAEVPKVKLEVLNGAGVHRLGRAVERELLARGFDVYRVGDVPGVYEQTTVVDLRDPAGGNARAVATALAARTRGCPIRPPVVKQPVVEVAVDSGSFYEVRLILGRDYQQFFPRLLILY